MMNDGSIAKITILVERADGSTMEIKSEKAMVLDLRTEVFDDETGPLLPPRGRRILERRELSISGVWFGFRPLSDDNAQLYTITNTTRAEEVADVEDR